MAGFNNILWLCCLQMIKSFHLKNSFIFWYTPIVVTLFILTFVTGMTFYTQCKYITVSEVNAVSSIEVPDVVLGNTNFCKDRPSLKYLIYVFSGPTHVEKRNNLRRSWANPELFRDRRTGVVFIIGESALKRDQTLIDSEQKQYGDIIQGNFVDNYKNLTLKAVFALKFITENCTNVKYFIKSDDDVLINIFEVTLTVKNNNLLSRLMLCHFRLAGGIERNPKTCGKHCVPMHLFPGKSCYPRYCFGSMYLTTYDVIKDMYSFINVTPFYWIEDVYVTGFLRAKAQQYEGIKYIDKGRTTEFSDFVLDYRDPSSPVENYILADVNNSVYFHAWGLVTQRLTEEQKNEITL